MTTDAAGRIEVVPEVLLGIAAQVMRETAAVAKMATVPGGHRQRGAYIHDGIVLEMVDDQVQFDIYAVFAATENLHGAAAQLQRALTLAVRKMVGIPVVAVNIHIEDVAYADGEAV